jgi:hypothetical protein
MNDLETRLTAALHADAPPARDPVFRVEVLMRLERARFRRRLGRTLVVAGVLAVLAAMNAPAIDAWMAADSQRLWVVSLAAAAMLWGVLVISEPRFRTVVRVFGRWLYP